MCDPEWWRENSDSILFYGCETLAVFFNSDGNITLRQQDFYNTDDWIITVPLDSAERLATRILDCVKEGREALQQQRCSPRPEPPPEPEREPRLALPAPNGKHAAPPVRNGGAEPATKTGAAHG
jgi:hypothetical protein